MEHWQGDWTPDEIRAFCLTAQKFGCGDKWGLFATYIPHRVGYQVGAVNQREIKKCLISSALIFIASTFSRKDW